MPAHCRGPFGPYFAVLIAICLVRVSSVTELLTQFRVAARP
jgi:hypothetical protein